MVNKVNVKMINEAIALSADAKLYPDLAERAKQAKVNLLKHCIEFNTPETSASLRKCAQKAIARALQVSYAKHGETESQRIARFNKLVNLVLPLIDSEI